MIIKLVKLFLINNNNNKNNIKYEISYIFK